MSGTTGIEWCDATFNPWHGCEKVSPGCAHCYAEGQSRRFNGPGMWGAGHSFRWQSDAYWEKPLAWARTLPAKLCRRPRVFCASMADVFEDRPELDEHRERLFLLMQATPELDWLLLTKRPESMRDWLGQMEPPYANAWLGVSIENARHTWRADVLRDIPAAVRFISAEPLLGSLYRTPSVVLRRERRPLDLAGIDWVIVGGESGRGARPMQLDWAREILEAVDAENYGRSESDPPAVALFVKQLGANPMQRNRYTRRETELMLEGSAAVFLEPRPLKLADSKGGDITEWPTDLRIREFPQHAAHQGEAMTPDQEKRRSA